MQSYHARATATPPALAFCPAVSRVRSRVPGLLVIVWSGLGICSWWRQLCCW